MYSEAYLSTPYAGARTGGAHSQDIEVILDTVEVHLIRRPVAGYASVPADIDPSTPDVPIPEEFPTRILAQDILSGEWLSWELPLGNVEITFNLSGATSITGDLTPDIQDLTELGLEPWGTWLHVEDSGQIRASGVLLPPEVDADSDTLSIEAVGFSGYADGIPFMGEYSKQDVDPWTIVTDIWAHVQSYPDAKLGVVVDPGTTPVRLGNEKNDDDEIEPYELNWWNSTDCGKEINDLATETPFEYIERVNWNENKTDVEHHLVLGYPRHGARRRDLRFAQGENILEAVTAAEPDDTYASEIVVLGAGEGKEMIRGTKSKRYRNRLRRVTVVDDETVTKKDRATAMADEALRASQAALTEIQEVVIDARHENAKLGSFQCGDDVLIGPVDIPYRGTVNLWHRITSYTYRLEGDSVRLTLSRMDAVRGEV